jgi:uncharacterized SAM-binding protein YcdF (DUF218 family)
MNPIVTTTIATFLLPPLCLIALGVFGAIIWRWYPRAGKSAVTLSVVLLIVLSMPAVGNGLLSLLERDANAPESDYQRAQAIVALAGGRNYDIAEFGGDTVDKYTLERVRLAALIQRKTQLPLLVTGGRPDYDNAAEAELMQTALKELSSPAKWMEAEAKNTAQNATLSRAILQKENINTIILVTHGWHMPRARQAFERAGFEVIPVGAGRHEQRWTTIIPFLPSAEGLHRSEMFMHEVIGMAWYWLRDGRNTRK